MSLVPNHKLADLSHRQWDIIVIGGGISGASVAEVAARSGLKCLLLEQRDFAWGASSRSGKWVHGGLRYLKEGQVNVTWHSVREREKLCAHAPGLISLRPMYWPLFKKKRLSEIIIRAGLIAYDILSGKKRRHKISQAQLHSLYPKLGNRNSKRDSNAGDSASLNAKSLKGAMCFYEGQTDDARLTYRVIQSACAFGAIAMNYTEVSQLVFDTRGKVSGVIARSDGDSTRYTLQAKQVISATGAWSDRFRNTLANRQTDKLRPLRGSHLVFDQKRLPITEAIILEHPRDKRPGFIAPFQGRVFVGNTDIDHEQDLQAEPFITQREVDYLLETIQYHFPDLHIVKDDIISTFSGVRPVVDSGKEDPSKETRDHVIWHENDLITIGGGKLTTFQNIAIDALMRAKGKFPHVDFTRSETLFTSRLGSLTNTPKISDRQGSVLIGRYGDNAERVLAISITCEHELIPGTQTFWFELAWCAQHENIHHLDDLLLRRTRIGLLLERGGESLLPKIRQLIQEPLAWSDERWQEEVDRYLNIWKENYFYSSGNSAELTEVSKAS